MKLITSTTASPLLTFVAICCFILTNSAVAQSQKTEDAVYEIKEALRLETQYFFQRNIKKWEGQWSHGAFVMKCYIREGKYLEQLGWASIRQSARDYMEKHPEPEQPPTDIPAYEIEVFGKSAFVSYMAPDTQRGKKREIRLMVREQGKWKIGYMSTNYVTE
ncbi:MAG: hypothetical protein AAFO99_05600 [Bacteroidota bacterium]